MARTRSNKVGNRELALDSGLLLLKGTPGQAFNDSAVLSAFLLGFVDALCCLSKTDVAILRAVSSCGSFKAAARVLAPGRPSYRSYIQQRFKVFRRISGQIGRKVDFAALISELAATSSQGLAADIVAPPSS
jgi:hypothetical protein